MSVSKVEAREKAREAKARRDESRISQEKQILKITESFYLADAEASAARDTVAVAEAGRATAVGTLMDLKEPVDSVATLCGISAREVRALRKLHRESQLREPVQGQEASAGNGTDPDRAS